MLKIMIRVLEVFTIEYIPRLPISLRKPFYKLILPLRKVKDKVALNGPKHEVTYEDRLEFAKLSRQGLNNSGSHLLKLDETVKIEKLENTPVDIYKFTPNDSIGDTYGIYFHGGGYYAGSIISHKHFISQLSAGTNIPFYFFEYRLSPEHVFPAAHDDAKAAVEYINNLENGKSSIWAGESAGGGLSAGLVVDDSFNLKPDKLVLLSPWLDLSDSNRDRSYLKNKDILLALDGMHFVGEYYAGEFETTDPVLSPVFADINNFPETLIQVCSNELLYNDAIEFTKKLREKGTKYELQVWDDLWHAWHFFPIHESYEATQKVISFITADSYSSPK
tara:strand:- start:27 stop:1025 length:999 start_codon:yes stop_codon:yes gene_type:complete